MKKDIQNQAFIFMGMFIDDSDIMLLWTVKMKGQELKRAA